MDDKDTAELGLMLLSEGAMLLDLEMLDVVDTGELEAGLLDGAELKTLV